MQVKSSPKSSRLQAHEMQVDSSLMSNLKALTLELDRQRALHRIWVSQDFLTHLLPQLTQANKWLDPQSFKDDKEFQRAYNVIWAKAKVSEEIITLLSGAEARARDIQERIEKDKLKHGIT